MNLSLYVLLASENELVPIAATADSVTRSAANLLNQRKPAIYDPYRPTGKVLLQASHRQSPSVQVQPTAVKTWVLGASVFANAIGFLVMSAGMLLLLQIAQVSLS